MMQKPYKETPDSQSSMRTARSRASLVRSRYAHAEVPAARTSFVGRHLAIVRHAEVPEWPIENRGFPKPANLRFPARRDRFRRRGTSFLGFPAGNAYWLSAYEGSKRLVTLGRHARRDTRSRVLGLQPRNQLTKVPSSAY